MKQLKFGFFSRSSRERVVYVVMFIGLIMYITSVIAKVSLIETAAMYTPIATAGGWYINQETKRESTKT